MRLLKILLPLLFISSSAFAETFEEFSERVKYEREFKNNDGLGMMISGGIALVGGSYGWSVAETPVEKGFYSIAQTLGLLAIGYGAEHYFLKQDEEIFVQVLNSGDLSIEQKNRMVESYLREKKEREESTRWIRRVTYGMGGILSLVNAGQTKDQSLKSLLYLAATVQIVWAVTF